MTTSTDTSKTTHRAGDGEEEATSGAGQVRGAVREVGMVLEGVGRSVPDVVRTSRSAIEDLFRTIESGSNERVSAGVTLSLGLAIGMLISGAPRLLIAVALAPVAAMALVLADRRAKATGSAGTARA